MNLFRGKKLSSSGAATAGLGVMSRASNQLSTLLLMLVAARFLTPSEFGVFSLAVLSITLIRTLLYCGAFEFLLKSEIAEDCASEALLVNIIVAIGLTAPAATLAVVAWIVFDVSDVPWIMLLLLPSNFISAGASWQESLCLKSGKTRSYYAITTASEIISAGTAVVMFLYGFGLYSLVAKVYIASIMVSVLYWSTGTAVWSKKFDKTKFVEILTWSFERYGAVLLTFGSTYAADLMLGAFLSPAATGIYRGSSRLVTSVADLFTQPTRLLGMTFYSKQAASGSQSGEFVARVFSVAAVVGWSALAGLAISSQTLVPLLLGPSWSGAAPVVSILCLARAFSLIDASIAPALVAHNKQRSVLVNQTLVVPVLVASLLILSPYGVLPATYAVVLAAGFNSICMLVSLHKHLRPTLSGLKTAGPIAIVPAVSVVVGGWIAGQISMRFSVGDQIHLAAVIVFGALFWCFAVLSLRRSIRSVVHALNAAR